MMAGLAMTDLTMELISGNLFAYWLEHRPEGCETEFPGRVLVTDELPEWGELQITTWLGKKQRVTARATVQVRVAFHLYVRRSVNFGRLQEFAEEVRRVLENRLIALNQDEELKGYLRLREAELRDLSTREQEVEGSGLRHAVLVCPGRAEAI